MELFAFGMFAGMIFALIFFCVLGAFKNDGNVDQGKPNDNSNIQSSGDSVSKLSNSSNTNDWPYDKGSKEEKEELEYLTAALTLIKFGLSRREQEILMSTRAYIERELDD